MANNKRILPKILNEIGYEHHFQIIEHGDGWIVELNDRSKTIFIHGYSFPNNKASIAKLCDDKAALSNVLHSKGIPTVPHAYFMNPKSPYHFNKNWKKQMVDSLKEYKQIVVKPNNGTGGDCVFRVNNIKCLNEAVNRVFARFDAIAISPFINIDEEYRLIILNGKVELSYQKQKKNNEWRHNLQLGAIPIPVKDKNILNILSKLALRTAKAIGIDFASIDIVQINNTFKILEINSGVMLEKFATHSKENYLIAKKHLFQSHH